MAKSLQCSFERYEKKYFLTPMQQQYLMHQIRSRVRPDDYGRYTICNIYYDTDDWRLVRASIEKPAYKEKLRVRSYGVPTPNAPVFVELKKKCGGIVYKRRITAEIGCVEPFLQGAVPKGRYGQIGEEILWFQNFYHVSPKVFIAYDRTAFAGLEDPDLRITFDTGLRWRRDALDLRLGDGGRPLLPGSDILMELKLPGACPLWLSRLLSEARIFPTSFSKYGTCYIHHILGQTSALPAHPDKEVFYCA